MTILDSAREGMDPSIRPQDDLFGHVNGRWLEDTEIPSDKSSWGAFIALADDAEKQVRDIITGADEADGPDAACSPGRTDAARSPGRTDAARIGDLYASFMDSARVESLGIAPLQSDLTSLHALTSPAQLPACSVWKAGRSSPIRAISANCSTARR